MHHCATCTTVPHIWTGNQSIYPFRAAHQEDPTLHAPICQRFKRTAPPGPSCTSPETLRAGNARGGVKPALGSAPSQRGPWGRWTPRARSPQLRRGPPGGGRDSRSRSPPRRRRRSPSSSPPPRAPGGGGTRGGPRCRRHPLVVGSCMFTRRLSLKGVVRFMRHLGSLRQLMLPRRCSCSSALLSCGSSVHESLAYLHGFAFYCMHLNALLDCYAAIREGKPWGRPRTQFGSGIERLGHLVRLLWSTLSLGGPQPAVRPRPESLAPAPAPASTPHSRERAPLPFEARTATQIAPSSPASEAARSGICGARARAAHAASAFRAASALGAAERTDGAGAVAAAAATARRAAAAESPRSARGLASRGARPASGDAPRNPKLVLSATRPRRYQPLAMACCSQ